MKKFLDILLMPFVALLFFSCGPAEIGDTFNFTFDNIYTVNKHAVVAEDGDSLIDINNMENTNYKTGDRAYMILRYYYDYNVMTRPHCDIYYAGEVIPTRSLSAKDSIDAGEYAAPIDSLHRYDFLDRSVSPVWVMKNRQNMNISYYGTKENASFAMTVCGIDEDCIELDLHAKAPRNGDERNKILLSFDISNIGDFLTDEQKDSLSSKETLRTKISFTREFNGETKRVSIIGGEFANPFK